MPGIDVIEEGQIDHVVRIFNVLKNEKVLQEIVEILKRFYQTEKITQENIVLLPQMRVLGKAENNSQQHISWHQDAGYWWY